MARSRHGRYGCRSCLREQPEVGYLSDTGLCLPCAAELMAENSIGLTDPNSVFYKRWEMVHKYSRPGGPKVCTPPSGWTPPKDLNNVR